MVPIALAKAIPQQGAAIAFVSVENLDANERQVPMRLDGPEHLRLFKHGTHFTLLVFGDCFCDRRFVWFVVHVLAGSKPERNAVAIIRAPGCSCFDGIRSKCPKQAWNVPQV